MKAKKTTVKAKKPVAKKTSEKDIMKQLQNPNLTAAEKSKLLDKLYKGIAIK